MRRLSEIIVISRASLSTALISRCARLGIPVSVALESGQRVGTFAPDSREWFEVARVQGNRYHDMGETARLSVATLLVATKIDNQAAWVTANRRAGDGALLDQLRALRDAAQMAATVEQARGHEGRAARLMFEYMRERISPALRAEFSAERRQRGAPDRINSMLNFSYHMLATRLNTMVRASGLNPHLGFLHDGQDDYGTLVADVMEPFRVHVDRTVVRLVNTRQVQADHFEDGPHGLRLTRDGRSEIFLGLEQTWGSSIGGYPLRELMTAQVKALKAWLQGEGPLWWHRWANHDTAMDDPQSNDVEEPAGHLK